MLNADGSLQTSVFFNPPCVWHTILSQLWLYRLLPRRIRGELLLGWHWSHDRERSVPMLGGAAILAKREMIEEVGGFNERFHMYSEDNEWCWRITTGKLAFDVCTRSDSAPSRRAKLREALDTCGSDTGETECGLQLRTPGVAALAFGRQPTRKLHRGERADRWSQAAEDSAP